MFGNQGRALRALAAGLLGLALAGAARAGVTITTVDSAGDVGQYPAMVLNGSGNPVIGYYVGAAVGDFRLAFCADPACSSAVFRTVTSAQDIGQDASLGLAPLGVPVASFYDATNGDLKLAICNGAACSAASQVTLDGTGNVGRFTSIALRSFSAFVSYYDVTNRDLKIVNCFIDTQCAPLLPAVTVDSVGSTGQYTSLRLNASGAPVIAYQGDAGALKLAVCDASCSTSTITTLANGVVAQHISMQLDASGFPVIAYKNVGLNELWILRCGDATCSTSTQRRLDSGGDYASLQLDANGYPVIAYQVVPSSNLLALRRCLDATCATSESAIVDSEATRHASLRIGLDGNPIVAYYQVPSANLKVARFTPTVITSVTPPADGTYDVGQALDFTVTLSEPVINTTIPGPPRLPITIGATTRYAELLSGNLTNTLVYRYVVQPGDQDLDGIEIGAALDPNGGAINGSGFAPILTLNNVGSTTGVLVNTAPAVTSVTPPANGTYRAGQALDFTVAFDDPVAVTGTPRLPLTIGAAGVNADYLSGGGTATLAFRYVVQSGQLDLDGIAIGAAIDLNGGDISFTGLPAALALNNVGSTAAVLVNAVNAVTSVVPPASGTYVAGQALDFAVTFVDPVTVSGAPRLPLAIGAAGVNAAYLSGSGTATVVFRYIVQPGDLDLDGIAIGAALDLNGGDLLFMGVRPGLALNNVGSTASVLVNGVATVRTYAGPSATGTGTITATFTGGGPLCTFGVSRFIPALGDPASPPSLPAGITFPHGLFDFTTTGCTPGSSITMTVTYPSALRADAQYWKYGPTPADPAPHWYVMPATILGAVATFTIVDGGLGDDDLAANGTIVDQGGPGGGPTTASAPVPASSPWMLALLALLLLGAAGHSRKGRGV